MPRSYLFPGRDTEALSPQERQLETLYDRIDRPGNRITPSQFFSSPEAAQLLDSIHGALTDRIPPGSQIVQQTPSKVTYRDAQGYEHNLTRKPDGTVTAATNRPALVPSETQQGQQQFAQQLQGLLQQGVSQPATLARLDPETAAALQAISQAETGALDKDLEDIRGQIVAQLYGAGVNRSSVADDAAARFTEGAGRVRQAQRSDAANRELSIRNLLTTLGQQNRELQAGLYSNITGQGTQRDIAGAGLDIDLKRLTESGRQFDASNYLDQLRAQLQREELDAQNSGLNKALKISQIGANITGAVGGGLGAYRALTGGGKA